MGIGASLVAVMGAAALTAVAVVMSPKSHDYYVVDGSSGPTRTQSLHQLQQKYNGVGQGNVWMNYECQNYESGGHTYTHCKPNCFPGQAGGSSGRRHCISGWYWR